MQPAFFLCGGRAVLTAACVIASAFPHGAGACCTATLQLSDSFCSPGIGWSPGLAITPVLLRTLGRVSSGPACMHFCWPWNRCVAGCMRAWLLVANTNGFPNQSCPFSLPPAIKEDAAALGACPHMARSVLFLVGVRRGSLWFHLHCPLALSGETRSRVFWPLAFRLLWRGQASLFNPGLWVSYSLYLQGIWAPRTFPGDFGHSAREACLGSPPSFSCPVVLRLLFSAPQTSGHFLPGVLL